MKIYRKFSVAAIVLIFAAIFLTGCSFGVKTFESYEGIKITLAGRFKAIELENQTYCLKSSKIYFVSQKVSFDSLKETVSNPETLSTYEYARYIIDNNKLSTDLVTENGLLIFEFEQLVDGKMFYCFNTVCKGNDSFWICRFICKSRNKRSLRLKFVEYAESIAVE